MVSLNTVLAVGGIAAAYFIFKNLGGASGIGSRIGGGVAAFGTSLSESLNPLQNVFAQQQQQDPIYERYLKGGAVPNTLPFDENPSFIIKKDEPEKNDNIQDSSFSFNSIIPSLPSAGAVEYQGPKQQTQSEYYGPELPSKIPPYAGSLEYIFGNTTTNNQYNSNPALQGTGVLNLAGTNVRTSSNANPYGNFANPEYA
jgi:hypothetical protein